MSIMSDVDIHEIDLRSDTVTKPTKLMIDSIRHASLGDDVYDEDETAKKLEAKIATILGKQAALFVPSGTMANLIAIMVHCNKRGSEVIVGDKSHIFKYEQAGASQFGGVMVTTLKNKPDGTFDLDALEEHVRGSDIHEVKTMMVAVENTHNLCGGKVIPLNWLEQLVSKARLFGLTLHMDGARLFNATEYLGVDPAVVVKYFDSISICFSKSLGAPIGSALVGTKDFITEARRLRKALGGGMRQVGVIAAPCIIALDETIPVLSTDHKRAKTIAEAIYALKLPTFTVDAYNQQTNIIKIDVFTQKGITAQMVASRLQQVSNAEIVDDVKTEKGEGIIVKTCPLSPRLLRLVTHFQITDLDVQYTILKLKYVLTEIENMRRL